MFHPEGRQRFVSGSARALLAAALAISVAAPATAAVNIFLKVDTIPGEANDADHTDWVEILEFSHAIANEKIQGSGSPQGQAICGPLIATKTVDKATPKLYEACTKGTHLPTATLELLRADTGQKAYFQLVMKDVLITSVNPSAARGDQFPTETIRMTYGAVSVSYRPQRADGTLEDTPIQTAFDCPPGAR
jgi:type VI secretion system Hcp family effector